MIVRLYEPKDYEQVSTWMKDRQTMWQKAHKLFDCGMIVDNIACGFLGDLDGKIGLIDYMASNPHSTTQERLEAYDLLYPALQKEAEKRGYFELWAATSIEKVMALAMRHGMRSDGKPYYFFRKELTVITKEIHDDGRSRKHKPGRRSSKRVTSSSGNKGDREGENLPDQNPAS